MPNIQGIIQLAALKEAEHHKERKQGDKYRSREVKDITQFPDCHTLSSCAAAWIFQRRRRFFLVLWTGIRDRNRLPLACFLAGTAGVVRLKLSLSLYLYRAQPRHGEGWQTQADHRGGIRPAGSF